MPNASKPDATTVPNSRRSGQQTAPAAFGACLLPSSPVTSSRLYTGEDVEFRGVWTGVWRSPRRVHVVDETTDVIHRRFGQDAVAEVEDVAGRSAGALEHAVGAGA